MKNFTMKKKNLISYMLFFMLILTISKTSAHNNPIANSSSIIKAGYARFTFLTSGLVRMEWDSLGVFEDHATQIILNRKLTKPDFKLCDSSNKVIVETDKLKLTYIKTKERFNTQNLEIKALKGVDKSFVWNLSLKNTGNLKGTAKTLDNYNGQFAEGENHKKLELEDDLLSIDGWR